MSRRQNSRARSRANTLFLAAAVISGAAFGQVTSWVGPASGNWSNANNWSNGLPNGGGFTAMVDNGQAYDCVVALDGNFAVGTLDISLDDLVVLPNAYQFTIANALHNDGTLRVDSTSTYSQLYTTGGNVHLTGTGQILLQNYARMRGGGTWNNAVGHTIKGFGEICVGESAFTNFGEVQATGGNLMIDPVNTVAGFTNAGTISAQPDGALFLRGVNGGVFNNTAGWIRARGGSVYLVEGVVVNGGIVYGHTGGSVRTQSGHSATLNAVTNYGSFAAENSSTTYLSGPFVNNGWVGLNSTGNYVDLTLAGASVNFSGGGTIILQNYARIRGGSSFINVDNYIHGAGEIGLGELGIENQAGGWIVADAPAAALMFDPVNSGSFHNAGMLLANGGDGATVVLRGVNGGTFLNSGTILAHAGSNVRLQEGAYLRGGTITTASTGSINVLGGHTAYIESANLGGRFIVDSSAALGVAGAINNSGSISLNSVAHNCDMLLQGGTISFSGGGTINLQNFARIHGSGTLVNTNNVIRGGGEIALGEINVINNHIISADAGAELQTALTIDAVNNAGGFVNNGTLQAVAGGNLVLRGVNGGAYYNSAGRILAKDASRVRLQEDAAIYGGTLAASGTGSVLVLGAHRAFLTDLWTAGDVVVENAGYLGITNALSNNGTITLRSSVNYTELTIQGGTVNITGNGAIHLQNYARIHGGGTLVLGAGQTVRGTGELCLGETALFNNNLISAELNAGTNTASLVIDPLNAGNSFVNNGTLAATNAGLVLRGVNGGGFLNNNYIRAIGANVYLQEDASITGGTLATAADSMFQVIVGNRAFLNNVVNTGNITVSNAAILLGSGTLVNNGSINLNAAGNYTELNVSGGALSIGGTGTINISYLSRIRGGGTLELGAGQVVRGVGEIALGETFIRNAGLIDTASPGGVIAIDAVNSGTGFVNTGVLRASDGVLQLRGVNGGGFDSSDGSIDVQSTGVFHMIEGANLSADAIALNGDWTLDGSSYANVTNFRGGGSLNLVNGSVVQLRNGGGTVGTSRAVAVTTMNSARLDLADHDLIVDYTGATPIDAIRAQLRSAYGGGVWNGSTGITSGVAATSTIADGIGYAESTQIGVTNFSGQPVDGTSVLLHYTLLGDSNLDNVVNISDFALLAANFNTAATWYRGDYNYDGTTDIGDFALLAANFNRSVPAELPRGSVPEPTAVLVFALLGGARRRRH